jgi:hypothetical protein
VETVMRALLAVALLATPILASHAADAAPGKVVTAHGEPDGSVPGWNVNATPPAGWTADCCQYAKAIGVNLVMYQGDWTGDPDRVMVLNVWPSKLPSLADEWKADQAHYRKRDPLAKVSTFALKHSSLPCHGVLYEGTDHMDDIVVFCDPGKDAGVRLSWSMSVAADDPQRAQVTALFRDVVEHATFAKAASASKPASRGGVH